MARHHGKQIKDDATYERLRAQGNSKEKSARIANARANPAQHPSRAGGEGTRYEDRTRKQLYEQAREVGIAGRSGMRKHELIDALRNH